MAKKQAKKAEKAEEAYPLNADQLEIAEREKVEKG